MVYIKTTYWFTDLFMLDTGSEQVKGRESAVLEAKTEDMEEVEAEEIEEESEEQKKEKRREEKRIAKARAKEIAKEIAKEERKLKKLQLQLAAEREALLIKNVLEGIPEERKHPFSPFKSIIVVYFVL